MTSLRQTSLGWCAIVIGVLLGHVPGARAGMITFVSDTSWTVSDSSNNPIGSAHSVVLNDTYPVVRPSGATVYGYNGPLGWGADLSSIPGAFWNWAPGITGATPNANGAEYSFSHQFNLPGAFVSGMISVAVDDFAQVFVNGTSVGATGSVTDLVVAQQAQSALKTFDITPFLVSGQNTILVLAENGLFNNPSANYSENPAGVVFGGSLTFQSVPAPPSFVLLGLALGVLFLYGRGRGVGEQAWRLSSSDR
jgi:hypothetical protein